MAKTMTPSSMTDDQIDKAADVSRAILRKHLRKHRSKFNSDAVQQVLGNPALGPRMLAVFRKMVEAVSNMIVCHVKQVDRTRTPQQMLNVLGRTQWTNREVVDAMPRGQGQEADIYFWPVGRNISDDDLEQEYQAEGWVAADPYLAAAANKEDPALGDKHPNFAHWKDADGKWCYLACLRRDDGRHVDVNRRVTDWHGYWSVAVVRNQAGQAEAVR